MTTSEQLDTLWGMIDAADDIDDDGRRGAAIDEVLQAIQSQPGCEQSVELQYALAYAIYVHPDRLRSAALQSRLSDALRRTLLLDPSHALAMSYLGYNAYDLGEYQEAEKWFEDVDLTVLPPALRIKIEEMLLCCAVRIVGLGPSLERLKRFADKCEELPPQDVQPLSLRVAVEEALSQLMTGGQPLGMDEVQNARSALARIDRAGLLAARGGGAA